MIFHPPSWLPAIAQNLTELGTISDFVLRGPPGVASESELEPPVLTSADAQKSKTPRQIAKDVEELAAGLAHDLQWSPNVDLPGGKVVAILSENTLDYLTYCWAIQRVGGTCLLLHATTSPEENAKHLRHSNCNVLITSPSLLDSGRAATAIANESGRRLYLTEPVTSAKTNGTNETNSPNGTKEKLKTINELLALGSSIDHLPVSDWSSKESKSKIAYLCPTSGTSGVQKLARLTHVSIIANILQLVALERISRHRDVEVVLGVLPMSHVQGIVASHTSIYVRDHFILHTKFDMKETLASIQTHRINRLYLVPSVLSTLIGNPFLFKAFDLSSVDTIYVGAGSVTAELYAKTKAVQPGWNMVTGYGLTESPAAVAMSSPHEYIPGSVGVLLPSYKARLCREDGSEVESFDVPGELLLASPNQADGYLGDDDGKAATFREGWLHTGDMALFRRSPEGDAHLCIVDRLRDMIKVKGMQVAPVTIEECLRQHPSVADVAVIGVPDDLFGERPKAFVMRPKQVDQGADLIDPDELFDQLDDFIESKLTESHWIRGRYEILEMLPRNTSGKVSKGVLRMRG
ncbi:putative amp dependent CoA ligase [Truncatella angustata]|uniref:Amp dependent CoA ligase n=1 Tax=Truncatella angustata TaxID=152316 RepID=A0A9P8UFS8_9PEZI|nr:putative amp dependent CoA ligase [Truncatella angustata]KAH6649109.1 putative amp dependent CoA ligase [Truncatella angustata]